MAYNKMEFRCSLRRTALARWPFWNRHPLLYHLSWFSATHYAPVLFFASFFLGSSASDANQQHLPHKNTEKEWTDWKQTDSYYYSLEIDLVCCVHLQISRSGPLNSHRLSQSLSSGKQPGNNKKKNRKFLFSKSHPHIIVWLWSLRRRAWLETLRFMVW